MTITNKYDEILSPIKSRVYKFLDYKGIRKGVFFDETGLSSSNFRGKSAKSELGGDKIAKIITIYPELNTHWFMTGEGEMVRAETWKGLNLKGNSTDQLGILNPLASESSASVALVNRHSYANFITAYKKDKSFKLMSQISWNVEGFEYKKDLLAFEQIGDSMMDNTSLGIMDGDFLLGSHVPTKLWNNDINGQNFAILHKQRGIIIKQVFISRNSEETLSCLSKNKNYDDLEIPYEEIIDIYKIIKLKRDFRY